MNTTPHGFLSGDQVSLLVESENMGDENALKVKFEAMFSGTPQLSPVIEKMEPNAKIDHSFEWKLADSSKYRQLVIPVVTHYSDANLYPFSSVTYALVVADTNPSETIVGKTATLSMTDHGALVMQFRSLDDSSRELTLRVVAPKEIAVHPSSLQIKVPASGEGSAEFSVSNFSALPSSSYALTPLMGRVIIVNRYDQLRANLNWIAPSAIVFLLFVYGIMWVNQRKARRKAA
jgi:hypothetical protein